MKLPPAPTPDEALELALAVVAEDRFPMMATLDGDQPRVRPVSPVKTDGFVLYVASLRSSNKTGEIDRQAKVEICYLTKDHDQVRITGFVENVTDAVVRQQIWDTNPLLRAYLKTIDNPEFVLYKVTPKRVRYMREWALEYVEVPFEA